MVVPCPAGWPPLASNDSADWGVFADYVVDYPVRYWRTQEERLRRIAAGLKVMPRMVLVGLPYAGESHLTFGEADYRLLGRWATLHPGSGMRRYWQPVGSDVLDWQFDFVNHRWWSPRTALRLDRHNLLNTGYLTHPGDWPLERLLHGRQLAWAFFNRVAQARNTRPLPREAIREAS